MNVYAATDGRRSLFNGAGYNPVRIHGSYHKYYNFVEGALKIRYFGASRGENPGAFFSPPLDKARRRE